jgi:tyrosyl-tRNA synthetase
MATPPVTPDSLTAEEKYELITRGLQEVLKPEIVRDVLTEEKRPLVIYWGRSPIPQLWLPDV